jgi:Anti-sigma-K factor rskA
LLYSTGFFGREAIASSVLEPTDLAPRAGGEIRLYESGPNVRVELEVWGMPEQDHEGYYELWFVEDGERMSGGGFTVGPDGRLEADLNAPKIASTYPQVGVTFEKDTGDPRASDKKMLGGELREL